MSEFKIEKGIPAPTQVGRWRTKWPFASMAVGDSFYVPFNGEDPLRTVSRVQNAKSAWASRHNQEYIARRDESGVRVWRTK